MKRIYFTFIVSFFFCTNLFSQNKEIDDLNSRLDNIMISLDEVKAKQALTENEINIINSLVEKEKFEKALSFYMNKTEDAMTFYQNENSNLNNQYKTFVMQTSIIIGLISVIYTIIALILQGLNNKWNNQDLKRIGDNQQILIKKQEESKKDFDELKKIENEVKDIKNIIERDKEEIKKDIVDLNQIEKVVIRIEDQINEYKKEVIKTKKEVNVIRDTIEIDKNQVKKAEINSLISSYLSKGHSYLAQKKYLSGIDEFEKVIELDKENSEAFSFIGFAYSSLKRYHEAVKSYKKAINLGLKSFDIFNNLGISLNALKEHDDAIIAYKNAIELDKMNFFAYNNMGVCFHDQKKYEDAVRAFEKAIELNKNHSQTYCNLGVSLAELKQYEKAITKQKEAINIDKSNSNAHYNLSCVYSILNDKPLSLKYFKKSLELYLDLTKEYIEKENDFLNIKEEEEFKKLINEYF